MPNDWMLIGRVSGPFGVQGEMRVEPLTDFPSRFGGLDSVFLGPDKRQFEVGGVRTHHTRLLMRLEGIKSPEAVRDLRGAEIFVPRSEAAQLPPGHFYLEDALGLAVETTAGDQVGTVTEVLKTGSNEVFVVGKGSDAVLIPVIKEAVVDLDLSSRRVIVEPWVLIQE